MIGARIRCDQCGFVGEMEFVSASRSTATAPVGWATVSASIRIKGERDLTADQQKDLRAKIREKSPTFHVCPGCIQGAYEVKVNRLLGKSE